MNQTIQIDIGGGRVVRGPFFRPTLLSAAFSKVLATAKLWHNRRIAIRELSAMPDSLLRDIGIERHQITAAVYNFVGSPVTAAAPTKPAVFQLQKPRRNTATPVMQKAA